MAKQTSSVQRGKVTLIELGFLTLIIGISGACLGWPHYRYGWRGVEWLIGGFIAFYVVLPFVGLFGFAYLMALIYTGNPYYPTCETGKCQQRSDYERRRLDSYLYRQQNNWKESLLYALSCYLSCRW
jgi:hypothetical protein